MVGNLLRTAKELLQLFRLGGEVLPESLVQRAEEVVVKDRRAHPVVDLDKVQLKVGSFLHNHRVVLKLRVVQKEGELEDLSLAEARDVELALSKVFDQRQEPGQVAFAVVDSVIGERVGFAVYLELSFEVASKSPHESLPRVRVPFGAIRGCNSRPADRYSYCTLIV